MTGGGPRSRRAWIPEVLRVEPQFRLLFGGQVLSIIGDRVMLVALPFAVLEAGGGLGAVGLVVAAQLVPFLIFALVGGVLSDRGDRRRVLIVVGPRAAGRPGHRRRAAHLRRGDARVARRPGRALRGRRGVLPARVHRPAAPDGLAPRAAAARQRAARAELLGGQHRRARAGRAADRRLGRGDGDALRRRVVRGQRAVPVAAAADGRRPGGRGGAAAVRGGDARRLARDPRARAGSWRGSARSPATTRSCCRRCSCSAR